MKSHNLLAMEQYHRTRAMLGWCQQSLQRQQTSPVKLSLILNVRRIGCAEFASPSPDRVVCLEPLSRQ